MKPKTMILIVVAVGCGLVASYMTSRLLAERSNQPAENTVMVVVAKKKVQAYTTIKKPEDFFELQPAPEGPLTAKAIKTVEELQNKRFNKVLNAEAIVRTDDLLKKEDMIIDIPVGQRAIAIKVNPETLAGGFILPGARVDIISTMRRGDEPSAMVILQNMFVVAIDTKSVRDDNQATALGQTVTLAATPEECTRLALAAQQGELRLTLRSPDDKRLVSIGAAKIGDFKFPVKDRDPDSGAPIDGDAFGGPVPIASIKSEQELPPIVATPAEQKKDESKTHTLVVSEGSRSQSYVYTQDPDTLEWRAKFTLTDGDSSRKPALPTAAPETKPTPTLTPEPARQDDGKAGRHGDKK